MCQRNRRKKQNQHDSWNKELRQRKTSLFHLVPSIYEFTGLCLKGETTHGSRINLASEGRQDKYLEYRPSVLPDGQTFEKQVEQERGSQRIGRSLHMGSEASY